MLIFQLNIFFIQTRENWVRFLHRALDSNWIVSGPPAGVTTKQCAEQLEYGLYSISKNETTYKNKCGHKVICDLESFSFRKIHIYSWLKSRN